MLRRGSTVVLAGELLRVARIGLRRVHADAREEVDPATALPATMQRAETQRRLPAERLPLLQEDECRHVAQERHSELRRRLTAQRPDAGASSRCC